MKKLNIQEYIEDVDSNYSGIEGSAPMPEMYFSGAEGMPSQQPQELSSPDPFIISVENTTGGTLTAKLFGRNLYSQSANNGSAVGLVVTNGFSNSTYLQLLEQSASQPFETSRVRVESSNTTQVTKNFSVKIQKANGDSATKTIVPQNYFSEMQQQGTIVTIPRSIIIDGDTYIEAEILKHTTVTYTLFPREMVNTTRALGAINQAPLKKFSNPPVLIGTQGVYS